MAKVFRGALFGYKKKDVQRYVEEISVNFGSQLDECKAEIEKFNKELDDMEAKKAYLEDQKAVALETVASAREQGEKIVDDAHEKSAKIIEDAYDEAKRIIRDAQEKADFIVEDAHKKAETERTNMQKKLMDENQRLIKIRREILNIRRHAIKTLNSINIDNESTEISDEI